MNPPQLSVVVPVYNEVENVRPLADEIGRALATTDLSYEMIWVDDGSGDGSRELLEEMAAQDPRCRLVELAENSGQSAALAAGFRHTRGAVVVTLDADLQNDPADIPRLLEALEGFDVVSGIRQERRDSWLRRISSRIANGVRRRVLDDGVTDVGCSLKAYRGDLLRQLPMFDGMHRFLPALAKLAGARITEIPVSHRPRLHGEAKYNIRNRIWRALTDLMAVRWMQSRWIDRRLESEVAPQRPAGEPPASRPQS